MVETNDGVVKPVCLVDRSSSEAELHDHELLSPTCDECSDKRAVTLVTSPLSSDVIRTTLSKIPAIPMVRKNIEWVLLGCCGFKTDGDWMSAIKPWTIVDGNYLLKWNFQQVCGGEGCSEMRVVEGYFLTVYLISLHHSKSSVICTSIIRIEL